MFAGLPNLEVLVLYMTDIVLSETSFRNNSKLQLLDIRTRNPYPFNLIHAIDWSTLTDLRDLRIRLDTFLIFVI